MKEHSSLHYDDGEGDAAAAGPLLSEKKNEGEKSLFSGLPQPDALKVDVKAVSAGFWESSKKKALSFKIYFVIQMVVNVVFVAYYVMLAFKQREACTFNNVKKDGTAVTENVSTTFSVSFVFGFILHAINLTIGTFVEPCVRLTSLAAPKDPEEPRFSNLYLVGFTSDMVFRLGFLTFSVAQLGLIGSNAVQSCTVTTPALLIDATWMQNLAVSQLVCIPVFAIWRHFATFTDGNHDDNY